jgi:serine/threonine protein phosphatase 1
MAPRTFAIGDIHGCHYELEQLLAAIAPTPNDQLIFLGDYIDRGPLSNQVIETLIELKRRNKKTICLKGNHEDLFLKFLSQPESEEAALFILNGGAQTLGSYANPNGDGFLLPSAHAEFLKSLQTLYETPTHFFVHAGVPNKDLEEIDSHRDENDLLWIRESFLKSRFQWTKLIVHGHTPCENVEIHSRRINLDTGCVYGGKLSAIHIESGQVLSVQRISDAEESPVFLKDSRFSLNSQRVAKRFDGTIPVELEQFHDVSFSTLNYNSFGLLLQQHNSNRKTEIKVGQNIAGVIGPQTKMPVRFKGTIVRTESRREQLLYGVQLHFLENKN